VPHEKVDSLARFGCLFSHCDHCFPCLVCSGRQSLEATLFPAGLELTRLQVTNPDKPMTNAAEISRINLSLETGNLLRRKIIIKEMVLDGIQLNTPRKTSGALVSRAPKPAVAEKRAKREPMEKITLPALAMPDVGEILKREELESVKLLESLRGEMQDEKRKWQKRLEELPDKEKFNAYRSRIEEFRSKTKGPLGGLIGAVGDIADIKKDIQRDLELIKNARQELDRSASSLKGKLDQVKNAPLKDLERLKEKYSLSPQGLANMSRLLFGPALYDWTQKALTWYEKLKPIIGRVAHREKGREIAKPLRGKGIIVHFKERKSLPDFLIRQANARLQLQAGDVAGTIENITPDQDILGIPLTFTFSGEHMKAMRSLNLNGSLDHIIASRSTDTINAQIHGLELRNMPLSDEAVFPAALNSADADLDLKALVRVNEITADLAADLSSVRLSAGTPDTTSLFIKAIGSALSDVSRFSLKANAQGTLDNYTVHLTSDLDQVLKAAVGKEARRQAARLEKDLHKAILAKVDGPLSQTKEGLSGFDGIGGELVNRLNLGNSLLGDLQLTF
jgi:uncharacterized protein (TIGR03545 family)